MYKDRTEQRRVTETMNSLLIEDYEEEVFHRPNTDYSDYAAVRHCVDIIDKYRAESEKE